MNYNKMIFYINYLKLDLEIDNGSFKMYHVIKGETHYLKTPLLLKSSINKLIIVIHT